MKRIITCSDGTWNSPSKNEQTNVQKIFEAICNIDNKGVNQIKFYDQGVGTSGGKFRKIYDGATGKGLDDNILDAYKFILWNYVPGDEIYLFGFSRGAYTARSLAGLIYKCGILRNNDLNLIKKAYKLYRDGDLKPSSAVATKFREKYSHPEQVIRFIGVWDTVGALGIPLRWFELVNQNKYRFHDTKLNAKVQFAHQALAIDEKRTNFVPVIWQQDEHIAERNPGQVLEQVWFSGVHSNIGGGYPNQGLSDIALKWMVEKAEAAGLGFEKLYLEEHLNPNVKGKLYESNGFPFNLAGEHIREIGKQIRGNESVHFTVKERLEARRKRKPDNI
ncbi:MAG: DUF2235 domain-containing protein [Mucilaginibacter polytrichastri]|nr:DUF2235 domain-containing protein [Mucilaginibacter polytrichastri]